MKKSKYIQLICIFSLAFMPLLNVFADKPEQPASVKEYLASLEQSIVLRGDYLKAVDVAYRDDFLEHIQSRKGGTFLSDFLSKIENYDVHIEQKENYFIVTFGPTMRNNAPDIFGGGARYLIDSKRFIIKEKIYTK